MGGLRHAYEPPEGARQWIQVEDWNGKWRSQGRQDDGRFQDHEAKSLSRVKALLGRLDPSGQLLAEFDQEGFAGRLLAELRSQVRGHDRRLLERLPADPKDLLKALMPRSSVSASLSEPITPRAIPPSVGFRAGEVLSGPFALTRPGQPVAKASMLLADVSRHVGAVLAQRFNDTRPRPLQRAPVEALAQAAASGQMASWSLRVSGDGKSVEVALDTEDGAGPRSLGTVLSPGGHLDGVAVYRADPTDDLEEAAQRAGLVHNGRIQQVGQYLLPADMAVLDRDRPLANLGPDGRICVVAHGLPSGAGADRVGDLSAKALAKRLIKDGLPADFRGAVQLEACRSGGPLGHPSTYARQLQRQLERQARTRVTVLARPGDAREPAGRAEVLPAEMVSGTTRRLAKSREFIRKMERLRIDKRTQAGHATFTRMIERERIYMAEVEAVQRIKYGEAEVRSGEKLSWLGRIGQRIRRFFSRDRNVELVEHFGVRGFLGMYGARDSGPRRDPVTVERG
jgi:hypothetical protein